MNSQQPIFTEKARCQDCYKCVRACPVKAIQVVDDSAAVMPERCVYCGTCVNVCPVGAKKVRDDLGRAKFVLKRKAKVVASLARQGVDAAKPQTAAQFAAMVQADSARWARVLKDNRIALD